MEAEQVIGKILSEAQGQVDKIKAEAEQKYKAEMSKLDEEISQYKQQTEALAQQAAEDTKSHILATARMEVGKEYLAEKRLVLDEVFEQAQQKLLNLSEEDYLGLVRNLILKAIETGDEEVIVDENETRIDHKFIKHINRDLGPGYHGNLRLCEEKQKIGAGFILSRGKIKNNASLPVLISQARIELEAELARELFENTQ
ncbi:MAG: V-type ATP synthase subunit E [Planctomycetota bacterium]|jgi:vacuolar-type H+-ATPase subunit E/Vma4